MVGSGIVGSRRDLVKAVGVGLAGTLAAVTSARAAPAPSPASCSMPIGDTAGLKFWTAEYWAKQGDTKLYMYRKRLAAPKAGEAPLPVLFLVHGSSISARPSFDLSVPGHGEYSLMNVFAAAGYDTWTMDFEGYGRSTQTAGNSDIKAGVLNLQAAMDVLERETGQTRYHFFGESSGALRAGAFAMASPERVNRLILEAFTYTGKGSPTLKKRAEGVEYYRTHNRRKRDDAMIHSIFTRDKPGTSDPAVGDALAAAELPLGDSVPTGTYLDMTMNLPLIRPEEIKAPVLVVRGEYDGIATLEDLVDFYDKLPNGDRQLAIIPNAAHSVVLSVNRQLLWHVMNAFLTVPAVEPLRT